MNHLSKLLLVSLIVFGLTTTAARADVFDWENLQSDIAGVAEQTDANVVNAWGMALADNGKIWVANNGTAMATVYRQDGTPFPNSNHPQVVSTGTTAPTGTVFNSTNGFKVSGSPAKLIFVGEDGIIAGWNQNLGNTAATAVSNPGAIYKGATLGKTGNSTFLFVTNFASGQVETYDSNFNPAAGFPFTDPNLPANYFPFGIRNFNGKIYVTFVPKNPSSPNDELAGSGNGLVDVFTTHGGFVKRLVTGGQLNAPWGLAWVNNNLWVGNFGDGRINVYNPSNGNFVGTPKDVFAAPLDFNGLWDLLLTDDGLFFTAGIADEDHGMFGVIFTQ